jgi:hypothetical protein
MASNEELRLMDGLWLKGQMEGQAEVRLKSQKEAQRLRMMMYNAARRPRVPQEVKLARGECILQIDGECLLVVKTGKECLAQAMAQTLGTKTLEQELAESEQRFMGKIGGPQGERSVAEIDAEIAKLGE